MSWRLAKSLETLRGQIDEKYPKRNRASDGTIGDAAHAKVRSDHNPNRRGVVTALDLTHHKGYFNAHKLADRLIKYRHPNLKYVISNRRIAGGWTGWKWVKYSGANPHDKHIHVSVGVGADGQGVPPYDDTIKWNIGDDMFKGKTAEQHHKEAKVWRARSEARDKQIAELKKALSKANSKPPKEVIKEVEKIVEKPVVDPAIHTKLDKILNYLRILPAWVGKIIKKEG